MQDASSSLRLHRAITVGAGAGPTAADLIASETGLSKSAVKDAMNKGAVWLTRARTRQRLRRATSVLRPDDRLEIFYDRELLALKPPLAELITDHRRFSVWCKPAGLLTQGSEYGDHASIERQAAQRLERPVFVVHRLDREAMGLLVLAHDREAAARLSRLFTSDAVEKIYRVQVRGRLEGEGKIEQPLDGKAALSEYRALAYDEATDTTQVEVRLRTGRLHQIRRHMEAIGHPVMGDPRYGHGNKNREGLKLAAVRLAFNDPFGQTRLCFESPPTL